MKSMFKMITAVMIGIELLFIDVLSFLLLLSLLKYLGMIQ